MTNISRTQRRAKEGFWCSPRVAADLADVPVARVEELIQNGDVGVDRIGGRIFVSLEDVRDRCGKGDAL